MNDPIKLEELGQFLLSILYSANRTMPGGCFLSASCRLIL